jgi:hypothetical protein
MDTRLGGRQDGFDIDARAAQGAGVHAGLVLGKVALALHPLELLATHLLVELRGVLFALLRGLTVRVAI